MKWETVIGLEIHVQLSTQSKLFSGSSAGYGAEPNTQACAVDIGLPGTLPVLNKEVLQMAIKFGLAVNADIARTTIFERKNYFYPDLPKGYQITQHFHPIIKDGYIDVPLGDDSSKRIKIISAHLEEDAGKLLHENFHGKSGIDLNRAGNPLLEIVSAPDMRSAEEAVAYLKTVHTLVKYLKISDGNMQEGAFRCDANISVRPHGQEKLGVRTEVKNINSFKFVERAIEYEINRQIDILEQKDIVKQESLLYDSDADKTRVMRSKEDVSDYRYFPDPNLLPVEINLVMLERARQDLPELPQEKLQRFINEYKLKQTDADFLTAEREIADYFEAILENSKIDPKVAANWVMGKLSAAVNKTGINIINCPINAEQLGVLLQRIDENVISEKIAKTIFDSMWNNEGTVDEVIEKKGLKQLNDRVALEIMVNDVLKNHSLKAKEYLGGKEKLFGFFVGEVMRISKGKANPQLVHELLTAKLASN
jgi:aspartyl-tRNA(Asn)/glutamyl-tRNA(Gln) amidotransferase subunit B